MRTIGDELRKLLKDKNIKQVRFAEAMGFSPSRLSNYLSGKRTPDIETLSKMADYLSIGLGYFSNKHGDIEYPIIEEIIHSDTPCFCSKHYHVIEVPFLQSYAKKNVDTHQKIAVDKRFFKDIDLNNAVIIEVTAELGNGHFSKGDYVIAVKCIPEIVRNGDLLISIGRGGRLYQYIQVRDKYLIISVCNKRPTYLLKYNLGKLYIVKAVLKSL